MVNGTTAGRFDRRRFLASGATLGLAGAAAAGDLRGVRHADAQEGTPVPIRGKIAFGQPDRTADVYKPLIAGAKAEGQRRGFEILESFAEGRADKQIAEINTWIGLGVDAMTILPLDENAMQPAIEKAGADALGEHAANWINTNLGGQAEVAFLTADFHQTGRDRINGAEAKLMELAPGITVVNRSCDWGRRSSMLRPPPPPAPSWLG